MNNEDLPFRHYSLKHRVIAWISSTLFDGVTYTVRHGLLRGLKRKGGLGWMPESISGSTTTSEHQFWQRVNLNGLVVYDIGAFHGLLTIHFARQARQVVSFEPSPRNRARLQQNVRLNGFTNVTVRDVAVGSHTGNMELVSWTLMPGGSTADPTVTEALRKSNVATRSVVIQVKTLDQDVAESRLPAPDFIKIDVEGMEIEVLRGARETIRQHRPALFLEVHGETMNLKRKSAEEIVDCLQSLGYARVEHIETGTSITRENSHIAARGHLYAYETADLRRR